MFIYNSKEKILKDLTRDEANVPPKSLGNNLHFSLSEERNLTEELDISISEYIFSKEKIYFTAQYHKDFHLYSIDLKNLS